MRIQVESGSGVSEKSLSLFIINSKYNNIMTKRPVKKIYLLVLILFTLVTKEGQSQNSLTKVDGEQPAYILPSPQTDGTISIEHALANRRSHRSFTDEAISAEQLSQVLWAAYGITNPIPGNPNLRGGLRTAPSAGALYPFEIYILVGKVTGVETGLYQYISQEHKIVKVTDQDLREGLSVAAFGQVHIKEAPISILYAAIYSRMTGKYGDRGRDRFVCIDLGHSAQNVYLQAGALNLGTCAVGGFNDEKVVELMQLPEEEVPLYIMPVGHYK